MLSPPCSVTALTASAGVSATPSHGRGSPRSPCRSNFGAGDQDEILPHPYHAQSVHDALPAKPDDRVVANAGHFAFLAPCNEALSKVASEACRDSGEFDRVAFHREFNAAVVEFFLAKLPAR
jgi:predicted dienelactone hydrolase